MKLFGVLIMSLVISGCQSMPDGVKPVDNFDLNRYQGTWYEIARLDHRFEKGMDNVSANYSLRDDGKLKVVNKGFKVEPQKWSSVTGKAYQVEENKGFLKVSFFGPFYGSYVVYELDQENYEYAFVTGNTHDYLWLLARKPQVSEEVIKKFVKSAKELGFETDKLIYVNQDRNIN